MLEISIFPISPNDFYNFVRYMVISLQKDVQFQTCSNSKDLQRTVYNYYVNKKLKIVLKRVENTIEEVENAAFKYLLLFPQSLSKQF